MSLHRQTVVWSTTVLISALAAVRGARVGTTVPEQARPIAAAPTWHHERTDSLKTWGDRTTAADPFRLERRPATVRFGATSEAATPLASTRPPLVLKGIIGGPPWEALLEGVPERQGIVIARRGDRFATLRVRAVSATGAIVDGADTTWHLTIRKAWQ